MEDKGTKKMGSCKRETTIPTIIWVKKGEITKPVC